MWQARFFDRALRTAKEYNNKVEYIHLNPVNGGIGSAGGRMAVVQRAGIFGVASGRGHPPSHRPRVAAVRPTDPNLKRRTADLKTGGPRYPLLEYNTVNTITRKTADLKTGGPRYPLETKFSAASGCPERGCQP